MKLHPAMVRSRKATTTQATRWHPEIPTIFLNHDISGDFGCAEERVLALIDTKCLRDTVDVIRIRIVAPGCSLDQGDFVRGIAVNLVGAQVHERGFRRVAARSLEEVERAAGIDIKVIERS